MNPPLLFGVLSSDLNPILAYTSEEGLLGVLLPLELPSEFLHFIRKGENLGLSSTLSRVGRSWGELTEFIFFRK